MPAQSRIPRFSILMPPDTVLMDVSIPVMTFMASSSSCSAAMTPSKAVRASMRSDSSPPH